MSDPAHSCCVLFRGVPPEVRRTPLKDFAEDLRVRVGKGRGFECLITGDREISKLNGAFRRKPHATDVLSFPAAAQDGRRGYLGELAISWERAASQAAEHGHSAQQEIRILMLHGLLHLLGYDHEDGSSRMARRETLWRRKLGLPAGLIERSRA